MDKKGNRENGGEGEEGDIGGREGRQRSRLKTLVLFVAVRLCVSVCV